MAINFPDSPVNGDTHVVGNVTYVYNNAKNKWNGAGQTPNDRLTEGSNSLEITAGNDLIWTGDRVGLNTSSPESKLEVRDAGAQGVIIRSENTQVTNTNKALRVRNNSADNTFWVSHKGYTQITISDDTLYNTSTTNTSNTANTVLTLSNQNGSDGTGVNNYVGINFSVANGATSTAQLQYVRTGDNAGKFEFKARNTSTNYPNIMTLLSSGDIGINQTTPTSQSGKVLHISGDNGGQARIHLSTSASGHGADEGHYIVSQGAESGAVAGQLAIISMENRNITFNTGSSGANATRLTIQHDGNLNITDGNLVVANGHGIDFSAAADTASGETIASSVLNDYEEGTFTPTVSIEQVGTLNTDKQYGRYIKVGNKVTVWCYVQLNGAPSGALTTRAWQHGGLPFTQRDIAGGFDTGGPILYWTIASTAPLSGTAPYHLTARLFNNSTGGRIRGTDSSNNQNGQNLSLLLQDNTEYSYTFTYECA